MVDAVVNGKRIAIEAEHLDVPLVDFIRDVLGLKGAKVGCGIGVCGACTVHVDGVAERACLLAVSDVAGRRVTTIEGLAAAAGFERLHPVQDAWIDVAAPQCGYCQPGQIMTAAAFLDENPDPSDAEIRRAMNGNLCRCGTYGRIRKAVGLAARRLRDGKEGARDAN